MTGPYAEALAERTELGWLVAVALPPGPGPVAPEVLALLPAPERVHAAQLPGRRCVEWVGGRLALRAAAGRAGRHLPPVLTGSRREPLLPPGLAGSISHDARLAVALAGEGALGTLGVDVEPLLPERPSIERLVLREDERAAVASLPGPERWGAILRRFVVKEAVYKALHPHCPRFVGYEEAAVTLAGRVPAVELHLADGAGPFELEARVWERGGVLVAGVRLRRR